MKLRDTNLQVNEKNSYTYPPSCILPSFSQNTSSELHLYNYFIRRGFESLRAHFFSGNVSGK